MRVVTVTHTFTVDDGVTDDQLDYIIGTMSAQVDGEGLVGHDDEYALNEIVVPIHHVIVTTSTLDLPESDDYQGADADDAPRTLTLGRTVETVELPSDED